MSIYLQNATLGAALANEVLAKKLYTPETATSGLYAGGNGSVWSVLQADFIGDFALHCPARRAARNLAMRDAATYLYSFEITPHFTVNFPGMWLGKLGSVLATQNDQLTGALHN
eukprot:SAG31_NODE_3977_length_3702_cov_1.536775_3_plen_114_part_00